MLLKSDLLNMLKQAIPDSLQRVSKGTGQGTVSAAKVNADYAARRKKDEEEMEKMDVDRNKAEDVDKFRTMKKEKHYHAQINFEQGDVMNLPYSDNSFDRLVISFGLRNVSDYEKCLREIYRVAKKGAKFMILDLSHPRGFWDKVSGFYRFQLLPLIGKLLAKDYEAYEYLPNSIQIYPNQEKLVELLVKAGWQKVSYENIFGGVVSIHQAEK
jgi:demethylmenaquinone methyltransferase/2-methoxy-6-polyprenyl-1,4-benzoquinol methylase